MAAPGQPRTLRLQGGEARLLLLTLPLAAAEAALDAALTMSYKLLVDRAIVPRDARAATAILSALAVGFVATAALSVWRDDLYARAVAAILRRVRLAVFERCTTVPISFFSRRSNADVLGRFSTDLAGLESWLTTAMNALVLPALYVVSGLGVLFFLLEWRLALAAVAVWPLLVLGPRWIAPRASRALGVKKEGETEAFRQLEEALTGHRVVKQFGIAGQVGARFAETAERLGGLTRRAAFTGAMVERTTVITIYLVQIVALGGGTMLALHGRLSVGSLLAFLTAFWSLGWSVVVLARSAPSFLTARESARRLDELLDEPTDPLDEVQGEALSSFRDSLALDGVRFAYPGRPPVLDGVSLRVQRGEFVALVGPSGSGKSSVLGLLARLYDFEAGRLLVDGHDVRTLDARALRGLMAFVSQETVLFGLSLRENIRLGRPGTSDADVEAAARQAEIHDVIAALPGGYDAVLGQGAVALSGGQRQRIAIARALVRQPEILVLDEATSALDPATEAEVQATLLRARAQRTTIAVTHRLSTITTADRIFVLDGGRVVEDGRHDALVLRGGAYARLWRKQEGFTVSTDGSAAEVRPERLREIELLRPLDEGALTALASRFASMRARAGEVVVREGERSDLFYVVVRGQVRVTRRTEGGEEQEIRRLGVGDEFGELALLHDTPRTASVTAQSDCLFLTLTRRQFLDLLEAAPGVRAEVERVAAERLRRDAETT